ncbi:methyl-accepting chemotaxis protein [Verrucomicrobium sp. GAS474]|uniref:HAMP domain-containing methyl-accepting chemotaxis protein n=1 Tax=Verrucomicrobium sp. GAS474 TaxID=1882831 RepID=UPI00087A4BE6|nr:methyl-accepting chemotaxis protein [Verrucomicrobium sp. GAS474]SDU25430.1 methyl-accepting chemotaxis protein [Verrucomicrobium sp. GAS474]
MKNWTIRARVTLGFGVLITLTLALGLFAVFHFLSLKKGAGDVALNWYPSVEKLVEGQIKASEIQRSVLRMMMAETPEEAQQKESDIVKQVDQFATILVDYKKLVDPQETALYQATLDARDKYLAALAVIRTMSLGGQLKEAQHLSKDAMRTTYNAMLQALADEANFNKEHMRAVAKESNEEGTFAVQATVAGVATAFLLALGTGWFIIRDVNRQLNAIGSLLGQSSEQVGGAAEQVAGSSQILATGSSEQAASLEETSASLEEISSMTQKNAESADHAQTLAGETRQAAETGVLRTREMRGATEGIVGAVGEMADAIRGIKQSSDDVSKILKAIDEIAFQTNILALNAAVEAARAGEAGAGFAVVAEEVRALAQRSAEAAKETSRLIEASAAQSARGVEANERVAARVAEIGKKSAAVEQSLGEIVEKVRQVDTLVSSVAMASKEQNGGVQQITTAVQQIDRVTQANAAASEETASASEELNQQTTELRRSITMLLSLVGREAGEVEDRGHARGPEAGEVWHEEGARHRPLSRTTAGAIPLPPERTVTVSKVRSKTAFVGES